MLKTSSTAATLFDDASSSLMKIDQDEIDALENEEQQQQIGKGSLNNFYKQNTKLNGTDSTNFIYTKDKPRNINYKPVNNNLITPYPSINSSDRKSSFPLISPPEKSPLSKFYEDKIIEIQKAEREKQYLLEKTYTEKISKIQSELNALLQQQQTVLSLKSELDTAKETEAIKAKNAELFAKERLINTLKDEFNREKQSLLSKITYLESLAEKQTECNSKDAYYENELEQMKNKISQMEFNHSRQLEEIQNEYQTKLNAAERAAEQRQKKTLFECEMKLSEVKISTEKSLDSLLESYQNDKEEYSARLKEAYKKKLISLKKQLKQRYMAIYSQAFATLKDQLQRRYDGKYEELLSSHNQLDVAKKEWQKEKQSIIELEVERIKQKYRSRQIPLQQYKKY